MDQEKFNSGQHTYMDFWHMQSICRRHGRNVNLRKYPHLSFLQARWKYDGVVKVDILNHVPYSKAEAMKRAEGITVRVDFDKIGRAHV